MTTSTIYYVAYNLQKGDFTIEQAMKSLESQLKITLKVYGLEKYFSEVLEYCQNEVFNLAWFCNGDIEETEIIESKDEKNAIFNMIIDVKIARIRKGYNMSEFRKICRQIDKCKTEKEVKDIFEDVCIEPCMCRGLKELVVDKCIERINEIRDKEYQYYD